jgi:hypothetical protein
MSLGAGGGTKYARTTAVQARKRKSAALRIRRRPGDVTRVFF